MEDSRIATLGMVLASGYASMSRDPSTQVGCAIVDTGGKFRSGGFNGIPRGVEDVVARMKSRPDKYLWMEHAERNAIYAAASIGVSLKDCYLYVTGLPPCARCARGIIQVGIRRVYYQGGLLIPERWQDDMLVASVMLEEAGVERIGV